MHLIIVRHGETEWTLSGRYTGSSELTLTAHGRSEAEALRPVLAALLDGRAPTVFVSPRIRAIETAALALPGAVSTVDAAIAEFDYGDYEGMTTATITAARPGWNLWRDGCPGGESTAAVGLRADEFLRGGAGPATTPVVAVTHGHFSRILAARALGLDASLGRLWASTTASVSVVEDHHGQRCVTLWNYSAALLGTAAATS